MGRRPTGTVEPLKQSIRLKFTWNGKRCVETLDLSPTPANIKAADRLMAKVQAAIESGIYNPAIYFPKPGQSAAATFKDYAEGWLKTLTVERSTCRSYRAALNTTWTPYIGDKALAEVLHSDLARAVAERAQTVSGKTINNALIVIREVFAMAMADRLIDHNPAAGLKNQSHQRRPADPFTREERDAILAYMGERYPPQVAAYFQFAFVTGLRPSEQISLQWGDIDWSRGSARVSRARVDREEKGTKTNRERDVRLVGWAREALQTMKPYTFMLGGDAPIFQNPATGKPWADDQVQRKRYFAPTLRALGLRHRDAYQTRHTFATLLLMGGTTPAKIAKQLGHTSSQMVHQVYAKWIDDTAEDQAEVARMDAILSSNCPRNRDAV